MIVKRFAKGDPVVQRHGEWPVYRKMALTHAIEVEGPFEVETSEGVMRCEGGYLAVDSRGYPYPIAHDEFHAIYEREEA